MSRISPIPAAMLFSTKNCADIDLLKSPESRNLNNKLNITWHQCIFAVSTNEIKLIFELKIN